MKILSRKVSIPRSFEEICHILKTSAYVHKKSILEQRYFSMYCAKRRNWRYFSIVPVKGNIDVCKNHVIVLLEIHANLSFFVGLMFALLGIIGVCLSFWLELHRWIPYVGMLLIGLLTVLQSFWDGIEILDLLEFKLSRGT